MMNPFRRILDTICSLRLTVYCLAAGFVLVFAGTLAQVKFGLFLVQEEVATWARNGPLRLVLNAA